LENPSNPCPTKENRRRKTCVSGLYTAPIWAGIYGDEIRQIHGQLFELEYVG
jgi:hypothetical protein